MTGRAAGMTGADCCGSSWFVTGNAYGMRRLDSRLRGNDVGGCGNDGTSRGNDVGGCRNDGESNLLRPGRNLCRKSKRNRRVEGSSAPQECTVE